MINFCARYQCSADELTLSLDDVSSSTGEQRLTTQVEPQRNLESMATLDDVDEDEAFIMELMAIHDDEMIIEDLEMTPPPSIPQIRIDEIDDSQGEVSDVRHR